MKSWQDLFDGQVEVKPPLGTAELAGVPARRGVFLLETAGGEPILLTTAADIRARLRFRLSPPEQDAPPSKRLDLRALACRVRWVLADSHFETDWRFLQLARAIYPEAYRKLLSFKSAAFVLAGADPDCPALVPVTEVRPQAGEHFGPFLNRRVARRFVECLQEGFALCRRDCALRSAPRGLRCVYGQIGKCLRACEGAVSMAEYGEVFARACRYAAGAREEVRRQLEAQMRELSCRTAFEEAAQVKARLARLGELEGEDFRRAASIRQFQYLLVQRGPTSFKAKLFLADAAGVLPGGVLDFPPQPGQLEQALATMRGFLVRSGAGAAIDPEQLALVAHYLFAGPERAGLAVRFDLGLTPGQLAERIVQSADRLRLKAPVRRGQDGK